MWWNPRRWPQLRTGTITPDISTIAGGGSSTFAASFSGGNYDTLTQTWSIFAGSEYGSINASTGVFTAGNPSQQRTVTIAVNIVIGGTGVNAPAGTSLTINNAVFESFDVLAPALPNASVSAIITGSSTIGEGSFGGYGLSITGTYDTISYSWTRTGNITISAGQSTASVTVLGGTLGSGTLRCTVSVTGTGTDAKSGTSATSTPSLAIDVNDPDAVTYSPDGPYSTGDTVTATLASLTGTSGYRWEFYDTGLGAWSTRVVGVTLTIAETDAVGTRFRFAWRQGVINTHGPEITVAVADALGAPSTRLTCLTADSAPVPRRYSRVHVEVGSQLPDMATHYEA